MQPDPRKYLWDALHAAGLLRQFAAGKTFGHYQDDVLLRSAVERQFEIVGEALGQLARGLRGSRATSLRRSCPHRR